LRALESAKDSLGAAVPEHCDTVLDWHPESEYLVLFLVLANSAVTNSFCINLSWIDAAQVSAELAAWVSACHSVLRGSWDADDDCTTAAPSVPTTMADTTMPTPAHHNPAMPHHCATDASIPATDVWRMLQDNHEMVKQLKQSFAQLLSLQWTLADAYTKDRDASAHMKKSWAKLDANKRRMALAAASTDGEHPAGSLPYSGLITFVRK